MKHGCVEGRDHEIISVRITLGVTHFPRYGVDEPSFFIFRAIGGTIAQSSTDSSIPPLEEHRREAIVEKSFGRMQNPLQHPYQPVRTRYGRQLPRDLTLIP